MIACNSSNELENNKKILQHTIQIRNLGEMKYFLGFVVAHSKHEITICQRKYCLALIRWLVTRMKNYYNPYKSNQQITK